MAENVTIGRTSVYGPFDLREVGHAVSFGFDIADTGGTVLEARARTEQLRGLRAGDIVPVTWTEDDRYDGFYRLSAPITFVPNTVYLNTGLISGVFAGVRVPRPEIRSYAWFSPRTVLGTAADAQAHHALPAGLANGYVSNGTQDRVLDAAGTGACSLYRFDKAATSATTSSRFWIPDPATFYDGLPMLEQDWGTDDWYPVVGNQFDPEKPLRLSNGYLQCEHADDLTGYANTEIGFKLKRLDEAKAFATGSTSTVIGSSTDPASYGEEIEMGIDQEDATDADVLIPVRIVRNDTAAVIVRYRMPHVSFSGTFEMEAALYRGEPFVRFRVTRGGSTFNARLEMSEVFTNGNPTDSSGAFARAAEGNASPSSSDGWRWWLMGENSERHPSVFTFYDITDSGASDEAVWACGFGEDDNSSYEDEVGVIARIRQWRAAMALQDYWATT